MLDGVAVAFHGRFLVERALVLTQGPPGMWVIPPVAFGHAKAPQG
ncbi:hypothetical protein GA0070560_11316 [Micromonospora halophytica]|uniref:Uncharacterized protein n=1 Tax=Micromonospora halophytica TaxID=47864 RepID=A0A1C5IKJ0_9ACTN|nr:hypothetical protein GA0070560_11316 [Micromonospora halophytica]